MLVSDRGTAFTSKEFADFLSNARVRHRQVAVASPWANGLAERVNRFLKSSLAKLVDNPSDWKNQLSKIQYVINNTHHTAVKDTPSKLMLGYDQRAHEDVRLREAIDQLLKVDREINKERESSRDVAIRTTEKIRAYNKTYYDAKHKTPTKYKVGDFVLIRDLSKSGINNKLKPNYRGLYRVAKALNKNR